ncbi:hypothetical protein [Desertivirga brevis]|uniref:hypothetical protein n=1 Tax=Desertivirga brevis TaxID=2810310 RepID=UPI001A96D59F|nr:hypothetical protein [Pedobacter sp. SYSU D00873]
MAKDILLHILKTIRYRTLASISGAAENFGDYKISPQTRSPKEIINHMSDLARKANSIIRSTNFEAERPPLPKFEEELGEFLKCLEQLNETVVLHTLSDELGKKLIQGPLSDMLTHIGQLAMLNGLNGNKIPKQNYFSADMR